MELESLVSCSQEIRNEYEILVARSKGEKSRPIWEILLKWILNKYDLRV
jgi:hypothetical protein